jgi:hypothetical protein
MSSAEAENVENVGAEGENHPPSQHTGEKKVSVVFNFKTKICH